MKEDLTNNFFDINKFPAEEGLVVFPISMSRISNDSQNAKTYMEYIHHMNPRKFQKSSPNAKAGGVFLYSDILYFNSTQQARILKNKYLELMLDHKLSFQNLLKKEPHIIHDSFSYSTMSQAYLHLPKFVTYFIKLKDIYSKDKKFQEYLKYDFEKMTNLEFNLDDIQVDFFLEEHLLVYCICKGLVQFENKFIQGHEKWILMAYPGKPLKAHVYLHQQNFFKLDNSKNKYENSWYNLESKILYDFDRVDLETIEL